MSPHGTDLIRLVVLRSTPPPTPPQSTRSIKSQIHLLIGESFQSVVVGSRLAFDVLGKKESSMFGQDAVTVVQNLKVCAVKLVSRQQMKSCQQNLKVPSRIICRTTFALAVVRIDTKSYNGVNF